MSVFFLLFEQFKKTGESRRNDGCQMVDVCGEKNEHTSCNCFWPGTLFRNEEPRKPNNEIKTAVVAINPLRLEHVPKIERGGPFESKTPHLLSSPWPFEHSRK